MLPCANSVAITFLVFILRHDADEKAAQNHGVKGTNNVIYVILLLYRWKNFASILCIQCNSISIFKIILYYIFTLKYFVGTPAWMSPELITGGEISIKTDVYSFAVILWEMYSRKNPYQGLSVYQVGICIINLEVLNDV